MATATTATKSRAAKAAALNAEQATPEEVAAAAAKAAAPVEAPAEETPKKETEAQKRNRLRNEAERVIINRHKSEFEDVATQIFAENGLKFNKRMSEQEKAKAKVDELIAKHPELKDALLASLLPTTPQDTALYAPAGAQPPAVAYDAPADDYIGEGDYSDPEYTEHREGE